MKIYTKTGDEGKTSLLSGTRVNKNHPRIDAYGFIDQLNSSIGLILCQNTKQTPLLENQITLLNSCQHYLFNIGSHLACDDDKISESLPVLNNKLTNQLENNIDLITSTCDPLKNFILPGGHPMAAHTHVARCICRNVERLCSSLEGIDKNIIPFLNRLSDYFFCLARLINKVNSVDDVIWSKEIQ